MIYKGSSAPANKWRITFQSVNVTLSQKTWHYDLLTSIQLYLFVYGCHILSI